ncbi:MULTISPECIES: hypothetical protein [Nitrosomonas]|uniref:hypothetical protein n=1 Tax=Nitrosomonas TaxID=914 RepID=UPI00079645E5|nr:MULTISPECIES: hypothetical protein [Nitrosomonas]KXK38992.1 MAG: hypothetical protein UZ02_AOB001002145 [Nitrosomonas europaea]QOJ08709.1 MAG: hypothetical protein HRU73_03955 [Nitrosomonas sp. H1_AOB3]HNR10630.1 hypothetical protein [Nitrosomonas europaea]
MTTTNDADNETYDQSLENDMSRLLPDQSVLGEPEPWESWETSLCLWSIGIGIAALVILGILVDWFLLPGQK